MNLFLIPLYRKWAYIALCLYIITSWFSVGYHHPDEHFQVLEFCNYKLGYSAATALPWEFSAQCRPAFQPFFAFCLAKAMLLANVYNPFILAFLLRLCTALLTWWVACRSISMLLPVFSSEKAKNIFVGSIFFLWFFLYNGSRFTAEQVAGLFFMLALTTLPGHGTKPNLARGAYLVAGLLLGFSLYLRLQMGFAFLGLGVWLVVWLTVMKQKPSSVLPFLIAGGLVAVIVNLCLDHWLYGTWVCSPYNYFSVNILQHKAASFGVAPWWWYVDSFIQVAVPPLSVVLLLLFMYGVRLQPLHLVTLCILPFIIGHMAIGHKELRFLNPMQIEFVFVACVALDKLLLKEPIKAACLWSFRLLFVLNTAVLAFRVVAPVEESMHYFQRIYNHASKHPTLVVAIKKSPYRLAELEVNFYKHKNMDIQILDTVAALPEVLKNQPLNGTVFYLSPTLKLPTEFSPFHTELVYCYFPDWLLRFNLNDWQSRSRIWALYRIYPQ